MTCVYKEYEVKIKMLQEQLSFYWVITRKLLLSMGVGGGQTFARGVKNLEGEPTGGIFPGGRMSKF